MSWLPPFSQGRDRTGAFGGDAGGGLAVRRAGQRVVGERRQRERRNPVRVGVDEGLLAGVPAGQQLGGGRGAEEAGVGDAGVADAGDVPGGGLLAVEVPDGLVRVGEAVGEEAAAVVLGEDAGVAPALPGAFSLRLRYGAQVEDVHDEQVAGLGALHRDGAAEHVGVGEVDVTDVVGRVVVADLVVGPVPALDAEIRARLHGDGRRDVGVPAVVAGDLLVSHGHGLVDAEDDFGHERPPEQGESGLGQQGMPGVGGCSRTARGRGHFADDARFVGAGLLGVQGAGQGGGGAGEHRGGEDPAGLVSARVARFLGRARPIGRITSKVPQPGQRY